MNPLQEMIDRQLAGKNNRDPYVKPTTQEQIASYQSADPRRTSQMNLMNDLRGGFTQKQAEFDANRQDLRTTTGLYGSPVTVPGQGGGTPGHNRYQTNPYTGTTVGKPGMAPPSDYQQARQRQIYQDDFQQKYGFDLYKPESHQAIVQESGFDPNELKQGIGYNEVTKPANPMHGNYEDTGYPYNPMVPEYRYPVPTYDWFQTEEQGWDVK
jgi:hypothetical protein